MAQRPACRWACTGLLVAFAATAAPAQTELISKAAGGGTSGSALSLAPAITPDGRWIAFASEAQDLLAAGIDSNLAADIYLAHRSTGAIERLSVDMQGGDPDAPSTTPRVSRNARWVAFLSDASDLVPGDTNGFTDVFVRDRLMGTTTRVSVGPGGVQADLPSLELSLSGNGRWVAFMSVAGNLLADAAGGTSGDQNGQPDVFVHDVVTGVTQRVSVALDGTDADAESRAPSISLDGRYVAFESKASNLVLGDHNSSFDIFVHDRIMGRTTRVSVAHPEGPTNGGSFAPSISANGRFVAFQSGATNIVPGDTNTESDIFVRDLRAGTTTLASVDAAAIQGDGDSDAPSLSPDGRSVAFDSETQNWLPNPPGVDVVRRVYLKSLVTGELFDAGIAPDGGPGNGVAGSPSLARLGRVMAFHSESTNLVAQSDDNGGWDVFVRQP